MVADVDGVGGPRAYETVTNGTDVGSTEVKVTADTVEGLGVGN